MNESELIKRYFFREHQDSCIHLGIGDDAALVDIPVNEHLVITTDSMVEGQHFTLAASAYDIATKLVAVNLSDIAAMGAKPRWATLNTTLNTIDETWLQSFSAGLFSYLDRFDVALIGGDVTKGAELNIAMQLFGTVPKKNAIKRSGAHAGDDIYVTGCMGLAADAVKTLYENEHDHDCLRPEQKKALYAPEPRIEVGIALRGIATSAIDISDGLLHELSILCKQSAVGAELQLDQLPSAENCDMQLALSGGEDYELLFTANECQRDKIHAIAQQSDCPISRIGHMHASKTIKMYHAGELIPMPEHLGFEHF